ncbi:hypothetical protein D3C80_1598870 [compost metagenome]
MTKRAANHAAASPPYNDKPISRLPSAALTSSKPLMSGLGKVVGRASLIQNHDSHAAISENGILL